MMRVLVVDDSALMRRYLARILEAAGDMRVETCASGEEALARVDDFKPDVVTLDVRMPGIDGLDTLARLMARYPCPVLMVSAYTDKGSSATLEALALGAVDYVSKPATTISLHLDDWGPQFVDKVRGAAAARVRAPAGQRPSPLPPLASRPMRARSRPNGIVVVGASTGGPRALEFILPALPADFCWPLLLAQHMPPKFTALFAERMDRICALDVVEVGAPTPLAPGIFVAPGERDLRLSCRGDRVYAQPVPADRGHPWHPSVEALTESALEHYPPARIVGVLLTGMGWDGAAAMTRVRRLGGRTIAESEDSAVVFGMPGELVAMGGASCVLPAARIAERLVEWISDECGEEGFAPCR